VAGEIPVHWGAERIKWAARMVSGHTPDKTVESYCRVAISLGVTR